MKVRFVTKVFSKDISYVRFDGLSSAREVVKKIRSTMADGHVAEDELTKVVIDNNEIIVDELTDEEKKSFWKKTRKRIENSLKLKEKRETRQQMRPQSDNDFIEWSKRRVNRRVESLKKKCVLVPDALLRICYDTQNKYQPNDLTEDIVRGFFNKYANIVHIQEIENELTIRFANRYDAKNVLAVVRLTNDAYNTPMMGHIEINDVYCWAQVLTGTEEKKVWMSSIDAIERPKIEIQEEEKRKKKVARLEERQKKRCLDDSGYAGASPEVAPKRRSS